MKTEDIIKKLGIEPIYYDCEYVDTDYEGEITNSKDTAETHQHEGAIVTTLYTHSDLDRIVTEVAAGYEVQIKVLRDALDMYANEEYWVCDDDKKHSTIGAGDAYKVARDALSQSSPLAALEEVKSGYEAQIKAMRDLLMLLVVDVTDPNIGWRAHASNPDMFKCEFCYQEHLDCSLIQHTEKCPVPKVVQALSQSSPLNALEEVRKQAKIEALEVAAELAYNAGAGDVEEDLLRMANELKDE